MQHSIDVAGALPAAASSGAEEVSRAVGANNSSDPLRPITAFIKAGEAGHRTVAGRSALLFPGKCWEMQVDLDKQLVFPTEVTQTSQRPDVVMWSTAAKKFLIIELLCVLGGGNFRGGGWSATTHPAEARCRPLFGGSAVLPLFSGRLVPACERPSRSSQEKQRKQVSGCGYEEETAVGVQHPAGSDEGRRPCKTTLPPNRRCPGLGARHL